MKTTFHSHSPISREAADGSSMLARGRLTSIRAHWPRLFLLAAFVGLVIAVQAMMPGPTIVRECPHCKKQVLQNTIGSGNTRGARWWTDDFMGAPMLPLMPLLVKCAECKKLVWFEDAKELGRIEFFGDPDSEKRWEKARNPLDAVESDYLAAADASGLARKREIHARQRAWWLANDPARATNGPPTEWTQARRKNLARLAALLDERKDHELHQKAEIARELGQFEECLKLLEKPVGKECADTAKRLIVLAHDKKSRVEEIIPSKPKL